MSNPYTSTTGKIPFSKMNGLGNDFIVIDARERDISLTAKQVRIWADRAHPTTKGCDQVLIIRPPRRAACRHGDAFMQIFNADGREVEACGNGTRAVAAYLEREITSTPWHQRSIETRGGVLDINVGGLESFVIMPPPKFDWSDIPLSQQVENTAAVRLHDDLPSAFLINVGNPHAVFFINGNTAEVAQKYGSELVKHEVFKDGANINFAHIEGDNRIWLHTWERGVGLTQSCGTGACASVVAAVKQGCIPRVGHTQGLPAQTKSSDWLIDVIPPFTSDPDTHPHDCIRVTYDGAAYLTQTGPVQFDFDSEIAYGERA